MCPFVESICTFFRSGEGRSNKLKPIEKRKLGPRVYLFIGGLFVKSRFRIGISAEFLISRGIFFLQIGGGICFTDEPSEISTDFRLKHRIRYVVV